MSLGHGAEQALVQDILNMADPVRAQEVQVPVEVARVTGNHGVTDPDCPGERQSGQRGSPVPAGEKQVDSEDGRCQLEPGRDTDSHAFAAGRVREGQVGQHNGRQHKINLPETEHAAHGLKPDGQHGRRDREPGRIGRA